ncbi:alpha/beta hydrolase family protein [Paraglaciecola aquimarina]|uniref:Alpha/beta hydrolase family protein n=1 Tax=Paraglaciecola algarum TaxID=3050085 RepID=A0ABS9DA36_9ALTE|nr:DUF3530 family protein [Paraglaciecola sp. G1-23]MCF2948654.1 alpha/beta hydrolase family protein [Paraglaciecola sp. G1-23]
MLKQLDLERGLFPEEYKSMQSDDKQVFYVEHENNTAITRGVAILISDIGTSMVSQQSLAPLAAELNKLGWATVLLAAPELSNTPAITGPQPATPETTETPADTTDTSNNTEESTEATAGSNNPSTGSNTVHNKSAENKLDPETFDQQQTEFINLLKVGVKKAGEYPGFYLVIAQGSSAAWVTKIYAEFKSNIPDAFVAVSPFWPDRSYNQQLPKLMAKTPMPVLDIYNSWDNSWARQTVEKRELAALKSLKLMYRQRQVMGPNHIAQNSLYLSKEIHGWLNHMGW